MTLLSFLCSCPPVIPSSSWFPLTSNTTAFSINHRFQIHSSDSTNIFTQKLDTSLLSITESFYEDELWAAACLRVRSFNQFRPDAFGIRVSLSFQSSHSFFKAQIYILDSIELWWSNVTRCMPYFVFVKLC